MKFRTVPLVISLLLMIPFCLFAAGGVVDDPNGIAPDRYVYYPGTEVLAEDEIRLVACGTGMPAARHKQAATCWLIERETARSSSSISVRIPWVMSPA